MSLRKGSNVWIEDKERAWIPAGIVDVSETHAVVVVTDTGKKIKTLRSKLLPRDPDADDAENVGVGVDDMTKLAYLSEPGVLYNLARRYALNEIYLSK